MSVHVIGVEEIGRSSSSLPYLSPEGWDALPHPPLQEAGYAAREYRAAVQARVFRPGHRIPEVAHLATRVLAIAPECDADFSGVVHIELLNPSTSADFPMFWPDAGFHLMARGDAYLGITCKSITVSDLQQRDPARYGSLAFPHDSMLWDLIGAIAHATHLPEAGGLLAGLRSPAKRFATGWSQSGSFLRSYLSEGFHEAHTEQLRSALAADGNEAPDEQIIDGYLIGVSSGGFGPMGYVEVERNGEMSLDETFTPTEVLSEVVGIDDRRRTIANAPVPVIEYHSEDEAKHHLWHLRPDSDQVRDRYRCYQVPGRGHETGLFATSARQSENLLPPGDDLDRDDPPRHEGSKWLIAATVSHLVMWSDGGEPPRANPIPLEVPSGFERDPHGVDYRGIEPLRDRFGHALGGLRYLEIDLPLSRMRSVATARHIMSPWEHEPLSRAEADALYGSPSGYAQQARRRATELVAERWLLPEHLEHAIQAACARYPSGARE